MQSKKMIWTKRNKNRSKVIFLRNHRVSESPKKFQIYQVNSQNKKMLTLQINNKYLKKCRIPIIFIKLKLLIKLQKMR